MSDEKDMPDWIAVAEQSGFTRIDYDVEKIQEHGSEMVKTFREVIRLSIELEIRRKLGGTDDA